MANVERKLAAVLSADVVGYSRLMASDEDATVRRLVAYREQVSLLVEQNRGRLVDFTGDNFLAEFPTALEAVQCAVETQRVLKSRNADLPADQKMEFRIGVHLGDIRVERGRVYGDGVNIAARLEGLAEPSGICISATVHDQVWQKLHLAYEDLGEQTLKNIPQPVRAYQVRLGPESTTPDIPLPGMEDMTVPGFGGAPAIAVLSFDNFSDDPEQEYFADGIAEDLITGLSSFRSFPVIARNSSFAYKGRAVDVKQVSRELGVRYVVEGSVRRAGDRVRISAQLIDAITGHHVWAQRYDRELSDVFAVQDEITEAIVASMHPELEQFERERAARQEPTDLDAWGSLQRGWWHYWRFSKEDNEKARLLFARISEAHPNLAGAFCGLAYTHYIDVTFQWTDSPDRSVHELEQAARKSIALDSTDPLAQVALGRLYFVTGQMDRALACFELALRRNPSLAYAYAAFGLYLARAGRPDEGIAQIEKGMRLNPRGPTTWLVSSFAAQAHMAAGRYEQALEWARESVQQRPDWAPNYRVLAACLAHLGDLKEAKKALAEASRLQPNFSLAALRRNLSSAHPDFVDRYLDGLRKAGLPEE